MLVVSGRAVLFGFVPSVLADVAERHDWPEEHALAHDVFTNLTTMALSTALLDVYTVLVRHEHMI